MEFKIISDIENPVFNRREIQGELQTDASPSREEVRKIISENLKVSEDTIKVKTILGKFGSKIFIIVANIYSSKEEMDKIELKKKKDIESEKKKQDARKAEEEKPIEESAQESETSTDNQPQNPDESLTTENNSESQSDEANVEEKNENKEEEQ